ncbi:TetR/AcrR family transcriptional regulator C-terminal domain-containing protein [Arenibaculum pallidiluteum]|uniref:TetR/AcrR family transcriptional regulator C-terminal domain-containing protein n=1 Tax=Arenibaculum pallidiluteum TaxID=2812559 RepID=UPI001A964A88|nr:TetR/AcrR family transcriptional regulator C-terminal domain-containing protein [Arenibaculum pallidiluteum]
MEPTSDDARRPRLTRERIAEEALRLIDQDGLEGLSTRRLGARLGVEAMALYHHFPAKGALLDAVVERLIAEIPMPNCPRDGEGWSPWLRQVAGEYRALALRHPEAFVLLAGRRFNARASFAFLEANAQVLLGAGFSARQAAWIFRAVGGFVNGAGLALAATLRQARETEGALIADPAARMPEFPGVAALAPHLAIGALDEAFDFGLDLLLAGIARLPRGHGGRRHVPPGRRRRETRKAPALRPGP